MSLAEEIEEVLPERPDHGLSLLSSQQSVSDWSYKDARAQGWIPQDVSKSSYYAFVPSTNSSSCVSPASKPNQRLTFATQSNSKTATDSNAKAITPSEANGGYSTSENQI